MVQVKSHFFYHAYVLRCLLGLKWSTPPEGICTIPEYQDIVRRYLAFAYTSEWDKQRVLDQLRDKRSREVREAVFKFFPELKKDRYSVPEGVKFDKVLFETLKKEVEGLKPKEEEPAAPIKEEIDLPEGLTLQNFKEKLGKRFRRSKEQKARGISRKEAFQELLKAAKKL